jgi:hypothetical protein
MKIKNEFIAMALRKMGAKVNAELVIDDSNGVAVTFPDITEASELAVGVSVSAEDGTYIFADGDDTLTVVVLSGIIETFERVAKETESEETIDAETEQLLNTLVEGFVSQKMKIEALQSELKDLKVSLKHEDGKAITPNAKTHKQNFKLI